VAGPFEAIRSLEEGKPLKAMKMNGDATKEKSK
jgi:hypothetical protein